MHMRRNFFEALLSVRNFDILAPFLSRANLRRLNVGVSLRAVRAKAQTEIAVATGTRCTECLPGYAPPLKTTIEPTKAPRHTTLGPKGRRFNPGTPITARKAKTAPDRTRSPRGSSRGGLCTVVTTKRLLTTLLQTRGEVSVEGPRPVERDWYCVPWRTLKTPV